MNTLTIPILAGLLGQMILAWTLSDYRGDFRRIASAFLAADIFGAGFILAAWFLLAAFGHN